MTKETEQAFLTEAIVCGTRVKLATVTLTQREVDELELALYYVRKRSSTGQPGHGTDGHNRLVLLAKFAALLGITLEGETILSGAEPYTGLANDK